jgi:hypothetical protein
VALYIPAGARRRRTILIAVATLIVGVLVGFVGGRTTAPSIDDRISAVRSDARETAAGLRVLVLHDEAGAVPPSGAGDGGATLVLKRTRTELEDLFDRAPWLGPADRSQLLDGLDALEAMEDRSAGEFGTAAEELATEIELTFGVT